MPTDNQLANAANALYTQYQNDKLESKSPEYVKKLMDSEMKLLADLRDFNVIYNQYITCTDEYINPQNTVLGCKSVDMNHQTVFDAYEKLQKTSVDVQTDLKNFTNDPNAVSPAVYDASYQYIKDTHKEEIVKLRAELDSKLKELYVTDDSNTLDVIKNYDTTMYVGILWTILATTSLYFLFTKVQ